jgi:hypothetical protein
MLQRKTWLGVILGAVLLAACGAPATPTLRPVVVTVYLTGTAVPNQAATDTPIGIVAATATGTATLPPDPGQPSATPAPVYGPDTYPPGVSPFTGQLVDPALVNRMPIAAKIANFPYAVRPQSGLALADLVFEHQAEAGVTRFTALFLQNDPEQIGSIRSARFIDTELAPMFGAMLVTSGSSIGTMTHLRSNPWFLGADVWRLVSEETSYGCPALCRQQSIYTTTVDTNSLFVYPDVLRQTVAAHTGNTALPQSGFAFAGATPAGGVPVDTVTIDFSSAAHVAYHYDVEAGTYTRWQENDPSGEMAEHLDALTNQPITTANVVVLYVNHQNNFVPEDFRDGGNCGLEIQLWTIGPAKVFRDGQMYEGLWRRDPSTNMRLRLEDGSGQPLALKPGNTWFGLVVLTAAAELQGNTYAVTNHVLDTRSLCPIPPTETPTLTPEGYVDPNATVEPPAGETETPTP